VKVRLFAILVLSSLYWLFLGQVAAAQSPTPGQPSWSDALHFMVGPGAAVLAGLIISFLSEYWAKFQALGAKKKVLVYIGLCIVSSVLGTALAVSTGVWGAWFDIQTTWWPAVWAGLAASGIGTLFHAWVPERFKS
jgi:ABC-type microcin C transport system permease subunit YejE